MMCYPQSVLGLERLKMPSPAFIGNMNITSLQVRVNTREKAVGYSPVAFVNIACITVVITAIQYY